MSTAMPAPPPCRACACERDGVCNHGSPHTCGFATRAEAQAECDAANEALSDEQNLAAAALDWNMRQPRACGPRKVTLTTYFEPRQIDALRALSARTRVPLAVHVRTAVEQYLLTHDPPPPEPAFEDDVQGDDEPFLPVADGARMVLEGLKKPASRARRSG